MSMRTELAEMKDRLAGLKERIEADDAEAINEGMQLKADIEMKTAEIEQAEQKASLLGAIGAKEEEKMEMNGIKSLDLESIKGRRGSVSTFIKAYNDNEAIGATVLPTVSQNIGAIDGPLGVRDLFSAENISGNALTFFRLGALEGAFGATNEGAAKPQVHVPYTPVTVALAKIAGFMKETDELLSDAAFLESAIRNRGLYEFRKAIEAYLVGDLAATSGVQTGEATISFDNILKGKQAVRSVTGYDPDALLINPADFETLLLAKDGGSTGQYLLGGPAYGPYGNGNFNGNPRVWGLTVVESAAVPEGMCIVGAFKAGASVVTKAGEGVRVEVSNSDTDDFQKNRLTVRIEERLVLATRVPGAFVKVGTVSSSS